VPKDREELRQKLSKIYMDGSDLVYCSSVDPDLVGRHIMALVNEVCRELDLQSVFMTVPKVKRGQWVEIRTIDAKGLNNHWPLIVEEISTASIAQVSGYSPGHDSSIRSWIFCYDPELSSDKTWRLYEIDRDQFEL